LIEHEINSFDNFILGWYDDNNKICDRLIQYYKDSKCKCAGTVYGADNEIIVNKSIKDCFQCSLEPNNNIYDEYVYDFLQKKTDLYIKKYLFCDLNNPWTIVDAINIQHYPTGGGFHQWHNERGSTAFPLTTRHLVFMTYLNDVYDGGETEFYYQKIKIKPKKGLTLIWPVDWPFTHRGIPAATEEKFIVTGWYNYTDG